MTETCLAGFGLAYFPLDYVSDEIGNGRLAEVLTDWRKTFEGLSPLLPQSTSTIACANGDDRGVACVDLRIRISDNDRPKESEALLVPHVFCPLAGADWLLLRPCIRFGLKSYGQSRFANVCLQAAAGSTATTDVVKVQSRLTLRQRTNFRRPKPAPSPRPFPPPHLPHPRKLRHPSQLRLQLRHAPR